jgi:hypothetical protein
MVRAVSLQEHSTWEDWAGIGLGVLVGMSPWFTGAAESGVVIWNSAFVGVLVLGIAALEFVDLRRWEEVVAFGCGLWLMASPFVLGYGGSLGIWHLALGALIAVLAVLELWQDWTLSEDEMASHGR